MRRSPSLSRKAATAALLLAAWCGPAAAADYIVRTDGSDSACNGLADAPAAAGPACAFATPTHCASRARPGDRCLLRAGEYPRLQLTDVNGEPGNRITISGPESGAPAVIVGEDGHNTVQLRGCRYLTVRKLRIDSRGFRWSHGLDAKEYTSGGNTVYPHHIEILDNVIVGVGGPDPANPTTRDDQNTNGISTKSAAWSWVIRGNHVVEAGTGMYLGNSDGTDPFIAGVVEDNYVENPIGYAIQVKPQNPYDDLPGIGAAPSGPNVTVIRNNVLIKDGRDSPNGARPNLLVGPFPQGAGAVRGVDDLYEIYGNFIYNNPRESLIQASGRVSIHDNLLVDGGSGGTTILLKDQGWREWINGQPQDRSGAIRLAWIYNNTIYAGGRGIYSANRIRDDHLVVGNLILNGNPIAGFIENERDNLSDSTANAGDYVVAPSSTLGQMDFYPLAGSPGPCRGAPIDYPAAIRSQTGFAVDFNGEPRDGFGGYVFRGAYAGEGVNPGWAPRAGFKDAAPAATEPPAPPQGLRAR